MVNSSVKILGVIKNMMEVMGLGDFVLIIAEEHFAVNK